MNETSKASRHENRVQLYSWYCKGSGIDIGCGSDKLQVEEADVRGWDAEDGDAQFMDGVPDASQDFVYSSHCLEHMREVHVTLMHWSRILKTGGHMVIVVPDFLMYEHGEWPSQFNSDHKNTFSLFDIREPASEHRHYTLARMLYLAKINHLELVDARIEHAGYDWHLLHYRLDQTQGNAMANIVYVFRKIAAS